MTDLWMVAVLVVVVVCLLAGLGWSRLFLPRQLCTDRPATTGYWLLHSGLLRAQRSPAA